MHGRDQRFTREEKMPDLVRSARRAALLASVTLGFGVTGAMAAPMYQFTGTIAVPPSPDNTAVSHAGNVFATYDIGTIDPATNLYYLGDRANASVDIFNALTDTFVGRIGGSGSVGGSIAFSGQQGTNNNISGPNGTTIGNGQIFTGNGNSTVYGFTLSGNTPTIATNTGGTARVDELAFGPSSAGNVVVAVNNADGPPFLSFVNASTGAIIKKIAFDGTNGTPATVGAVIQSNTTVGGLEAPVYDPVTGKYYVSVPQIGGSGPGGVSEIDPNTLTVTRNFDFGAMGLGADGVCSPSGIVAGSDGRVLVACGANGATNTVLLDPRSSAGPNGAIQVIKGVGGEDQVVYDPATNEYYTASRYNPGGPALGIIDAATGEVVQALATTPGDHSVAVDPNNNQVFVPAGGPNSECPNGCILVYSEVPEPPTWALMASMMAGLAGLVAWRRRQ
jgi:hypothetical protein